MAPEKDQIVAGKYRLREPLAEGGMGAVWVARHVGLDVDVAVKFRSAPDTLDAPAVDRFKREAQAAARLKSPHVVHIHDYGVDDGVPYIAMELLEGEDLGDLLDREDRLSLARTAELVQQAAKGLECAHDAGIVHRDIKPRNLFLARHGQEEMLKILDFGIAKSTASNENHSNTSANVILGSPSYMSPEQARGVELDASSDVWSLAAVAYRALTGVPPFLGVNSQDTVIKICTEHAPPPSKQRPDLPQELDDLFERALDRDPARRFASAGAFARALGEIANQHPNQKLDARPTEPKAPRGRSTATETLQSPSVADAPKEPAAWPRGVLIGGLALGLLVVLAIATRSEPVANENSSPAPTPTRTAPPERPPHTQAASQPSPAPLVSNPPAPPPPGTPKMLRTAHAPPSSFGPRRARDTRASRPQAKRPAEPELDPVFGLPVAPPPSAHP